MQAFRWSDDNVALTVWVLTSGFPWLLEWPCWFALEDLEGRGEEGEGREKVKGLLGTWDL